MYIYKTEILTVGTKWFSDKADAADIAMLDKLLNESRRWLGACHIRLHGNVRSDQGCLRCYFQKRKGVTAGYPARETRERE